MFLWEYNMTDLVKFLNLYKDSIFILNQDLIIIYVNKAGEAFSPNSNMPVLGRYFPDVLSEYTSSDCRIKINQAIKNKETIPLEIFCEDSKKWLELQLYSLRDYNYGIMIRDISVRKELRTSKEKADCLVLELQKVNEEKDRYISMISHELRNPLATISMGLQLMDYVEAGSGVDIETRRIIKRQTNQLISLVENLLNVDKINRNKIDLLKENIDINCIIQESIEDYDCLFQRKEIQLKGELYKDPIYIDIDPIKFKQVIGNILSNSLKFTDRNGQVNLKVYKDLEEENLYLEIMDSGIGIDPKLLDDIFQPFIQIDNTLKKEVGGIGLGLAIVKGIIDLHGGSIKVESQGLGKGTTFTIILPMV